jgi:hypothetical protein
MDVVTITFRDGRVMRGVLSQLKITPNVRTMQTFAGERHVAVGLPTAILEAHSFEEVQPLPPEAPPAPEPMEAEVPSPNWGIY